MIVLRWGGHALITLLLTVLTQVGGAIYVLALFLRLHLPMRQSRPKLALAALSVGLYAVAWFPIQALAGLGGRVGLPCLENGGLRVASPLYCVAHRHYVSREMLALARELARGVSARHSETLTQTLDANFPFFDGFPLAPHLSHSDGDKLDIAFYYADADGGYRRGAVRSVVGYWAFEEPRDEERQPCRAQSSMLRWDQDWYQIFTRDDLVLDEERMRAALTWLDADGRARRSFLEPHLADRLRTNPRFVRFQGCHAARHDDHFHIELR